MVVEVTRVCLLNFVELRSKKDKGHMYGGINFCSCQDLIMSVQSLLERLDMVGILATLGEESSWQLFVLYAIVVVSSCLVLDLQTTRGGTLLEEMGHIS